MQKYYPIPIDLVKLPFMQVTCILPWQDPQAVKFGRRLRRSSVIDRKQMMHDIMTKVDRTQSQ